jgi:hypothetical protein
MQDTFTLTIEMAIAILSGLDAEILRYKDLVAIAEEHTPETVGVWQTRLQRCQTTRDAVMRAHWAE